MTALCLKVFLIKKVCGFDAFWVTVRSAEDLGVPGTGGTSLEAPGSWLCGPTDVSFIPQMRISSTCYRPDNTLAILGRGSLTPSRFR